MWSRANRRPQISFSAGKEFNFIKLALSQSIDVYKGVSLSPRASLFSVLER